MEPLAGTSATEASEPLRFDGWVVAPEQPDGVELVLHLADAPARAFQAASRQAGRPVLSLVTDDCQGEAERLKTKGVIVKEPYRRDYGIDAVFADSCGNLAQPAPGLTDVVMQPTCGPDRNWLCGADAWSRRRPVGDRARAPRPADRAGASLERPCTPIERPIGNSPSHRSQGHEQKDP
jgi:hypothetical protein